jgi:hypothetical protein
MDVCSVGVIFPWKYRVAASSGPFKIFLASPAVNFVTASKNKFSAIGVAVSAARLSFSSKSSPRLL